LRAPRSGLAGGPTSPPAWVNGLDKTPRAPGVEDGARLGGSGVYRLLGRLVAAHGPREHVGNHEGVERFGDGRAGRTWVTDVGRPLDGVLQGAQFALRLAIEEERVVLEPSLVQVGE